MMHFFYPAYQLILRCVCVFDGFPDDGFQLVFVFVS